MISWSANDALFLDELQGGRRWELYVATKLLDAGLWVQVPELKIRDHIRDAGQYRDQADVLIGPPPGVKLEIKSRNGLRFTGPDDVPSSRMPFFVTTRQSWEDATSKPSAVVVVSRETGGIVVIPRSSARTWEVLERRDKVRGIREHFLAAPRSALRSFPELVEALVADRLRRPAGVMPM